MIGNNFFTVHRITSFACFVDSDSGNSGSHYGWLVERTLVSDSIDLERELILKGAEFIRHATVE